MRGAFLAVFLLAVSATVAVSQDSQPCPDEVDLVLLSFQAADAALVAGDEETAARHLAAAAQVAPELIGAEERLLLARQAELAGNRKGAQVQLAHIQTLFMRRQERPPEWLKLKILQLEMEQAGPRVLAPPSPEAQDAFARAKTAARAERSDQALLLYRKALRLSPGYVEAALALGTLESRLGHSPEAIAAYRTAVAADPDRYEALVSLSDLLWEEPDRELKAESLRLLDHAVELRPDLLRIRKESAERWADWGDAATALERLSAYRDRATPEERAATDRRWQQLRAVRPDATTSAPESSSRAKIPFGIARRLYEQGSFEEALEKLAQAERDDPTFSPAPDLAATIYLAMKDDVRAEAALRRALRPSDVRTYERLANFLERHGRTADVTKTWEDAERAGLTKALARLAQLQRGTRNSVALYRRYLEQAPNGEFADEAGAVVGEADRRQRFALSTASAVGLVALGVLGAALYLRLSGATLAGWLAKEPGQAREIRPLVGRLRHEVLKHGGLLLTDARTRLGGDDALARSEAAQLLASRLYGERGLVTQATALLDELKAAARRRGFTLNFRKDPILSRVKQAVAELKRSRRTLEGVPRGVSEKALRNLTARLERAATALNPATGNQLGHLLDDAASTRVSWDDLTRLFASAHGRGEPPPLEPLGFFAEDPPASPRLRMEPQDWETIWRNLFTNALHESETRAGLALRLGLLGERQSDPITGQESVRFVLADNIPRALTADMIRGRAAERGLGVVADLVRKHDGLVDVGPPPRGRETYLKGIVLEFPALEEETP